MKYVIVGLGNPGAEYAHTRHNAGYAFVERCADLCGAENWREDKKARAMVVRGECEGHDVTFVLPQTYMNRSGSAVAPFVKTVKAAERLIVAYDDIDLPLGAFKIAFGRGSGGHKGLESVIRALKTKDFVRFRIGVAPATPGGKLKKPRGERAVVDFLMGTWRKPEAEKVEKVYKKAHAAFETIMQEGRAKAMNEFN